MNERFKELQSIGWLHLNKEERKEYRALKDGKTEEPAPTNIVEDEWAEEEEGVDGFKTARIKLYQKDTNAPKGLIVDYKHLKWDYDENTRQHDKDIYELTVLYEDEKTEKVQMSILDFSHISLSEKVEIVESNEKVLAKVYGKVRKTVQNREGYSMSPHSTGGDVNRLVGDAWVDEKVTMVTTKCIVKRPNGQLVEINNSRLNQ